MDGKSSISELVKVVKITNFLDKSTGYLIPLNESCKITDNDIKRIVEICNNNVIFNRLFAKLDIFKGRKYEEKDAHRWVNNMGKKGWLEQNTFVYIIKDNSEKIVCAIDIKSNNLKAGEIEYWAAADSPGWMTNTIIALARLAKNAGYKKLSAIVESDNEASAKVLLRARFIEKESVVKDGFTYRKFELIL